MLTKYVVSQAKVTRSKNDNITNKKNSSKLVRAQGPVVVLSLKDAME